MLDSDKLYNTLHQLENGRKSGSLTIYEFYKGLLELLSSLKDVLVAENINEKQIKKQIPLLLVFLKTQIEDLNKRGG